MKKILVIIIVVAIAITFLNDLGAYVDTRRNLIETARDAAETAARTGGSRNDAARAAAKEAAARNVTVYLYDQDDIQVEVWANAKVEGTWVYGLLSALVEGRPRNEPPLLLHHETHPRR